MKYLLTIYLLQIGNLHQTIQDYYLSGNDAIMKSNYDEAIDKYMNILDFGYESSDLYYNLGNAYYKNDNIGKSIWAYSKSLMLNPRDSDVKYNLSIAKARVIDHIELPKNLVLIEMYRDLRMYLITSEWFLLCSILTGITCLIHLMLNAKILIAKTFEKIKILLIVLNLFAHFIGFDSYLSNSYVNNAVIVENFVDVFSEPRIDNDKPLFRINEGTIVGVSNNQNNWSEISLVDGKKGWVQDGSILVLK